MSPCIHTAYLKCSLRTVELTELQSITQIGIAWLMQSCKMSRWPSHESGTKSFISFIYLAGLKHFTSFTHGSHGFWCTIKGLRLKRSSLAAHPTQTMSSITVSVCDCQYSTVAILPCICILDSFWHTGNHSTHNFTSTWLFDNGSNRSAVPYK